MKALQLKLRLGYNYISTETPKTEHKVNKQPKRVCFGYKYLSDEKKINIGFRNCPPVCYPHRPGSWLYEAMLNILMCAADDATG